MRFAIRDHRGNGQPFALAMLQAGHRPATNEDPPDVIFIDYDLPHPAYEAYVEAAKGRTLVIYPHGASFVMGHDLAGDPISADASLVLGEGQKQLLEAYEYPNPVHAIGWPWGRRGPEPKPRSLKRVLFAPLHPLGSGYLREDLKEENRQAFDLLLSENVELTVRHIGPLHLSGLHYEPGVHYIEGVPDGSLVGIETADVVVASQTFAAFSLVAGWPVVMFAFEREWRLESEHGLESRWALDWRDHATDAAYPYQLVPGACQEAAEYPNPPEVAAWKQRFIGPDFDPKAFAQLIEEITCSRTLT
jgi:hypothetical protein